MTVPIIGGPAEPHTCPQCEAIEVLLTQFLDRTDRGYREALDAQAKSVYQDGPKAQAEIDRQVLEQRAHSLTGIVTWWVRHSLIFTGGSTEPLEAALRTAFRENGIPVR